MINNNTDMILSMKDMFDYDEYKEKCNETKVESNSLPRFAQGVVVLKAGMKKYPKLDPQDAYIKMVQDSNVVVAEKPNKAKRGCCGQTEITEAAETPIPSLKEKLMLWSYNHISECLWCAGIRIGLCIGIVLTSLIVIILGG